MANISAIKLPNGTTYNLKDSISGYTTNTGTITQVKTTAGAHTTINVSSGAATFNVPTKTSHLTNDSGFLTSHQDISGKVDKTGDTMTGNLVVPALRAANTYYGLTYGRTTSTPVETILYTGIKWDSGAHMPVVHITGYAYGLQSPVEFKIGFYIYGGNIGYCGVTNMGSWEPTVYLFKHTVDNNSYVAVGLAGSCYFLQLQADLQDEMGKFTHVNFDSNLWSWSFLTTAGTIPTPDSGVTCIQVPYKANILNPAKVNGHTVNANVPSNAKFTDTVTTATTSGSGNAVTAISASNGALTVTKGSTFLLTSDISSWAKASSKPSYTFSEIGLKPTTISGYGITDAYTKTEVDNKVSAVLRYKGVKAAVSNLPTSGNVTGDVWHVTATSGEYAWDGTEWQELGTAISIPANTGSSTTGISIAAHGTGTVTGVQSTTTTASKVTVGSSSTDYGVKSAGSASTWTFEEKTIPNVTAVGSASTWTFEEKTIPNVTSAGTASSWTFEEKTIPNVTAAGSGSASLTFAMDTTDTKKLKITFSHTHTAPTIGTAIKVQSKSGGSNGTAPTLGTAIKVQSKSGGANGTAPTLGTAIKVQSKSGGANSTAPTLGSKVPTISASDVTVPIKNASASTFVTGTTHTITDNGHTHTI